MPTKKSYTELQSELSVILNRFEHAEHIDIDELLQDYAEGKKIIAAIEAYLDAAELSVKKLK